MMGYMVKKVEKGYAAVDMNDNATVEFTDLDKAADFAADTFQVPQAELDLAIEVMTENKHTEMHFGGFKGMFLFSK